MSRNLQPSVRDGADVERHDVEARGRLVHGSHCNTQRCIHCELELAVTGFRCFNSYRILGLRREFTLMSSQDGPLIAWLISRSSKGPELMPRMCEKVAPALADKPGWVKGYRSLSMTVCLQKMVPVPRDVQGLKCEFFLRNKVPTFRNARGIAERRDFLLALYVGLISSLVVSRRQAGEPDVLRKRHFQADRWRWADEGKSRAAGRYCALGCNMRTRAPFPQSFRTNKLCHSGELAHTHQSAVRTMYQVELSDSRGLEHHFWCILQGGGSEILHAACESHSGR